MSAEFDLLDKYVKGTLTSEERTAFDERLKTDESFRKKAEQHLSLVREMKFYGARNELRQQLEEIHNSEITTEATSKVVPMKRQWPLMAVAASVALICIAGTLFFTQSRESRQQADYQALRRNIDQIKKSQKLIMEDLAESKKEILPGNYAGTGFLISSRGYVATSYHVIREADSVVLENEKFGRLKAIVVYNDPVNDVSFLKIDQPSGIRSLPYTIATSEASLAEDVYTLGFPREDVVFGEGSISARSGFRQNPNAYQISIPVNPGNSGGPLLNSKGDLIGMISGLQTQTQGAAFAIKSSVLLSALEDPALDTLSNPLTLPRQNTIRNASRVQQVKQWQDFVFMVRVYKN